MENIAENLKKTRERVHAAEQKHGRRRGSVELLAVSKTQPEQIVAQAVSAGQRQFGENYVQEAIPKIQAFRQENLIWHFIGPIQSNKTRLIAEHFDWVHSVDRLKVAQRLSQARPPGLSPLNICIQVNISEESSKSGAAIADTVDLAVQISELPGLTLRGLMVIPAPENHPHDQRRPFRQTAELLAKLNDSGLELDTLSMGMSDDLEAAVAEGATMVRIGTAIFGKRQS